MNRPIKDERDQQIETHSRSYALEFMAAATQILTIMCFIKDNSAWRGSLALLFIGAAACLFYQHEQYRERPYVQAGVVMALIGIGLLVWFGISG